MKVQTRSVVPRCGAYAFTIYGQVEAGCTPEISIEGCTEEGMGGEMGINVLANATIGKKALRTDTQCWHKEYSLPIAMHQKEPHDTRQNIGPDALDVRGVKNPEN